MSGLEHLQNLSIQPSNRSTQQQQTNSQPQSQYSQLAAKRRSARDYQFGAKIGEGSYSTVYSALINTPIELMLLKCYRNDI